MYCTMYFVLRIRICVFRIQHSRISTGGGGLVACAPCPGDIKPKCQDLQEFQEFQAPSRCILSLVAEMHKTMPIYTSFFQGLCGMYGVPLSGQVPVLEYHKPWFLERVSSAIVWADFALPKKRSLFVGSFHLMLVAKKKIDEIFFFCMRLSTRMRNNILYTLMVWKTPSG